MKPNNILITLLITTLITPPLSIRAEESTAVKAMQGVQGALGLVNDTMGALQFSQMQMQGMVNQFAALQNQMNGLGGAMSQFEQTKQQLSVALAEAAQCIEKAKKDTSKYKKAKITPASLNSVEPSCSTYGHVIDSVKANEDQLTELHSKMICMKVMQDKINSIAQGSQKTFANLTQAATQVWNTRQQIIDTHQGIVSRLDKELNDKDNGYKAQLVRLKELDNKIKNVLNAGASKDGDASGFAQSLRNLKRQRVSAANGWYYNLMGEVDQCFTSDNTQQCSTSGQPGSPLNCVRSYVAQTPSGSPAQRAQANANRANLENTIQQVAGVIRRKDTLGNIDVSNPDAFLNHVNRRFNDKLSEISATFNRVNLVGGPSKAEVTSFVQQKYRECFQGAVTKFQADLSSGSGSYSSSVHQLKDKETDLNNSITNLIDEAQQTMTQFRTSFNKIYDRDLSSFASQCSAADNPYTSADCLRKLSVNLKGGIEGTRQSITLEDGSQTTYTPGATVLNLQTLTLDQSGKPSVSNTQTQCVGFDECINVLDRYQTHHMEQVESQEKQRETFVEQHNNTIETAMAGVAAQFSEISNMILAGAKGINEDMAKIGVDGTFSVKQVEGEKLEANSKTGLYDMPKDMKAALVGVGGTYSEIDNIQETTTAITERRRDLKEILAKATRMKGLCSIKKSDYEAVANRLGNCEDICKSNRIPQAIRSLEALLRKSQGRVDPDEKDTITRDYERCSRSALGSSRVDVSQLVSSETEERRRELQELREQKTAEEQRELRMCAQDSVGDLEALSSSSRESTASANNSIMNAVRRIADACPDDPEEAERACEEVKKAANKATPPDEGETVLKDSEGGSGSGFSNPFRSNSGSAL